MKLEFDDSKGRHIYRLDGKRCPNVTRVIEDVIAIPALRFWNHKVTINGVVEILRHCTIDPDAPGVESEIARALEVMRLSPKSVAGLAGARGSSVHHAFVEFMETGEFPQLNGAAGYIDSLKQFLHEHKPEFLDYEQRIYSPSLRVAGTYDALAQIDGSLVLIDWKTSKGIYEGHHLQGAAYEGMRRELGLPEATPMIVRLDESGGAPEHCQCKATWEDFKACHALYEAKKRITAKEKACQS